MADVNKVEANGKTLIDLTEDTVTADTLVEGRTAHLASGARVTGTFVPVDTKVTQTETTTDAQYEVLLSGTADSTTRTESARKNSGLQFNPANKRMTTRALYLVSDNLDRDSLPTSGKLTGNGGVALRDKDNEIIGAFSVGQNADGTFINLNCYGEDSSGSQVNNAFAMTSNSDGTVEYYVTDAAAFRDAIGLDDVYGIAEQVDYNTNNGVKNLLKVDIPEKTVAGLTFTPQEDGTILVNGTSTATATTIVYFNLENPQNTTTTTQHSLNRIGYGNFSLTLNFGEEVSGDFGLQILCYETITQNPLTTAYVDIGQKRTITIDTDKQYVWFRLAIRAVTNGKTYNNYTLKPMIRRSIISDDTFKPYAQSNSELTQNKLDKSGGQSDSFALTVGSTTFEIKSDGVYINGTKLPY